jgi:hypothetical protein
MRWVHGSGADQLKKKSSLLRHRRSSALPTQESVAGIHVRRALGYRLPREPRPADVLLFFTDVPLLRVLPAPAQSGGRQHAFQ